MHPAFAIVARREPFVGPTLTPAEYAGSVELTQRGPGEVVERPRQSEVPARPSRSYITFFLHPVSMPGAGDFLVRLVKRPRHVGTPRGRFFTDSERRNVDVPPGVPYGSLVGDMSGVAPYGLE